jgi:hypothetical protein
MPYWTPVIGGPDADGWYYAVVPGWPWQFHVLVEDVAGAPQIVGLRMTRMWEGADVVVSSDTLRRLPLRQLREVVSKARAAGLRAGGETLLNLLEERTPGQRWPREHYERVAEVYREAVASGLPPLPVIGERWHVSRAMASKYVRRARELGLLGWPAGPGVAGTTEERSPIKRDRSKGRKRR